MISLVLFSEVHKFIKWPKIISDSKDIQAFIRFFPSNHFDQFGTFCNVIKKLLMSMIIDIPQA